MIATRWGTGRILVGGGILWQGPPALRRIDQGIQLQKLACVRVRLARPLQHVARPGRVAVTTEEGDVLLGDRGRLSRGPEDVRESLAGLGGPSQAIERERPRLKGEEVLGIAAQGAFGSLQRPGCVA